MLDTDPLTQTAEARIAVLRHRLRSLDRAIRSEQGRAVPDLLRLQHQTHARREIGTQIARLSSVLGLASAARRGAVS